MDKKVLGLVGGALSALALLGPARAQTTVAPATVHTLAASSFDDLLQPLPNAVNVLRAVDGPTAGEQGKPVGGTLTLVDHHHNYRHHNYVRHRTYQRSYHRAQHHHHHNIISRFMGGGDERH